MIAYSDASIVRPGTAGLGVWMRHQQIWRVEHTLSLQNAELQAAALAVQHAHPGPLRLHLDCSNAARALTGEGQVSAPFLALAAQIHAFAQARHVELEVVRVLSEVNRAHPIAQHATTQGVRPAFPSIGSSTVRIHHTSAGSTVRGIDPPLTVPLPDSSWGSVALLPRLAPRLPAHQIIRVLGLTPFAAAQWRDPATSADPALIKLLTRAQWTLTRKGTRLVFPEDLP